jgi:hypothetical protein
MINATRLGLLLFGALALASCAARSAEDDISDLFGSRLSGAELERAIGAAAAHPLGSRANPVRASMPPGQRAYLERLRCSDGNAPAFERGGSVGAGPYGTILDVYQLRCLGGQPATADVYMDMYHDHVETRPVPGFTIKGS